MKEREKENLRVCGVVQDRGLVLQWPLLTSVTLSELGQNVTIFSPRGVLKLISVLLVVGTAWRLVYVPRLIPERSSHEFHLYLP